MFMCYPHRRVVLALLGATCSLGAAGFAQALDDDDDGPGFAVRVVDEQGKPLAGVSVSPQPYFDDDTSTWKFFMEVKSDSGGVARFEKGSAYLGHLCLSAFDLPKNLVAIASLKPEGPWDPMPTLVLHPACKVTGTLISSELAARGKPLGWTNVYLNHDGKRVLGQSQENGKFELPLPPGQFEIEAYGSDAYEVQTPLQLAPSIQELCVDPIDLPATRLALLEGKPAPALREVIAWKNSPPLELADLRGKVVLVDFWGYWCGPCIGSMPELMQIYDRYKDQGFEVVGVHVDLPESVGWGIVDTVAKLDAKLADIKKEEWGGRDLPFPIALVTVREVPYHPRASNKARCQASADFGVYMYPSQILIDRQGKIIGRVETRTAEGRAELEKRLTK